MIVDGVEVLYTMRNGKIVDPNIPMDGLVCYLDTRGKYNTDVYRNTLLDLSGNGNHGTLTNFNFTEESGYENGGLQFDGVDDILRYSHNLERTDPRTIFMDMEIEQSATEQGTSITLPFGLNIHQANNYVYNHSYNSYFKPWANMTKGTYKFVITIESTLETGKMYYKGNVIPNNAPESVKGSYHFDPKVMSKEGKRTLNRAMLYNRVLTEQEITQLMEV